MRVRRWFSGAALIGAIAYFLLVWPLRDPHPSPKPTHGVLAITGAKVYPSPEAVPMENAVVLVRDGKIAAIGPNIQIPENAVIVPCERCAVTAGFWNAHVHFTEPKWTFAAWRSRATLAAQVEDMLTSRGFSTVVDTGSDLRVTVSLRRRIERGELPGPAIYTAGAAIYPPKGIPYYVKREQPYFVQWLMPQPENPEDAVRLEERNIAHGADVLKLFTGSYIQRGKVLPMPLPIAKAAAQAAHRHGQLVYSHPSDSAGTKIAVESGVDILAHAPDTTEGIDETLLRSIADRNMAMIPTLKMFATTVATNPEYLEPIYAVVRKFHALGGKFVFGTDVGYMTDYSTADEFLALARCGLTAREILRMLTTEPAARFHVSQALGTLAVGKQADLVVLDGDPERDVLAFSRVRATIRNGEVVFSTTRRK